MSKQIERPDRKSQNRSSILAVLTSDRPSRQSERASKFLKGLGDMKSRIGDRASKLFGKDDDPVLPATRKVKWPGRRHLR